MTSSVDINQYETDPTVLDTNGPVEREGCSRRSSSLGSPSPDPIGLQE